MALNKVILIGNVGKDPEIRTMNNGNEVALFTLATTDSWKDKTTGERRDKTEWHRIVIYTQGLVNICRNYIKKGSKLYVEGTLQTRKWVDNQGIERQVTEVILQGFNCTLQLLESKQSSSNNTNNSFDENYYNSLEDGNSNSTNSFDSKSDNKEFVEEIIDDDIPF